MFKAKAPACGHRTLDFDLHKECHKCRHKPTTLKADPCTQGRDCFMCDSFSEVQKEAFLLASPAGVSISSAVSLPKSTKCKPKLSYFVFSRPRCSPGLDFLFAGDIYRQQSGISVN